VRLAAALALALVAVGCAGQASSSGGDPSDREASLEISLWRRGTNGPVRTSTLHCPGDSRCNELAQLDDPFAPLADDVACTEIFGGPQVARVHGTFRGEPVDAHFNRTDGCEIARWDKHAFLFPSG
jgi:hypothetical protein